ncbi:MAG: hypothetical protein AB1641_01850 [Thermodesulfobacteriota bacterium]
MEISSKGILGRLAKVIESVDKRQQRLKDAVLNFKSRGCSVDPWAATLWLQANMEVIGEEPPKITQLQEGLKALCDDLMLKFDTDFKNKASSKGLLVSGQWPKYFINHILPVSVNEKKHRVGIGEDPPITPLIERIFKNIQSQLKMLEIPPEKLADFLQELFNSYKELVSPATRTVAVLDLYKRIVINRQSTKFWRNASAQNFRPFRELDFKAFLTKLLKANLTSISGHQLRLHPPIKKGDSMYIYQPGENRFCHVGRVEFQLIEGGEPCQR